VDTVTLWGALRRHLWAWGSTALGLGDTSSRLTPTQVDSDTDWVEVACGTYYSLGLRSDGTLWAWALIIPVSWGWATPLIGPRRPGRDGHQLGGSLGRARPLSGVRSDGTLWPEGINSSGQLGLGDCGPARKGSFQRRWGRD